MRVALLTEFVASRTEPLVTLVDHHKATAALANAAEQVGANIAGQC